MSQFLSTKGQSCGITVRSCTVDFLLLTCVKQHCGFPTTYLCEAALWVSYYLPVLYRAIHLKRLTYVTQHFLLSYMCR